MHAKRLLFISVLAGKLLPCFSQQADSTRAIQHFSGSASVTNNGISLVPSFSLERPAVLFLLSLGGERFSIDPDIRFGLDGKPWTFLFWARYKVVPTSRFRLTTGAHLGLNHKTSLFSINGASVENTIVRRYLAAELAPSYFVAKNVSVGAYYLYSRGLDAGTVKNTHFITLNSHFSRLPIGKQFYLRLNPQVFYLKQDSKEGNYLTTLIALAKDRFPLSVSYLINKKLSGDIPGKDFISSVSLIYSFNRRYMPQLQVL